MRLVGRVGFSVGDPESHTLVKGKMPSTIIKEATEPLLATRRSDSLDSGTIRVYNNKNLRYGYYFVVCIALLAVETALWKKYMAPLCGSYCNLNLNKENFYFKLAQEGVLDYFKLKGLQYPVGVLYFYKALNHLFQMIPESLNLKEAIPYGIFFYFLFLSAYLMKRCRIPACLMLFFVLPLGLLLQGHALAYILPEMLGMTILLQMLAALVSGYQKTAVFLLVASMSFDSTVVFPLLPALMLCWMRTMGARCASFWMISAVIGFALVSGEYLITNPSAYLTQVNGFEPKSNLWNPVVWFVHAAEDYFKLNLVTRDSLETILNSVIPRILLQSLAQLALINFRWLRGDGGILGLLGKFMKSNRGHGIRPNPWTPRQTLTVIFESMLVSSMLRFPSLVHAEEFELLTVMMSGFFCVALAEAVPLPALFGICSAISFPLTFLYRQFLADGNLHFNLEFKDSLHFLPMLLLPISQLAVLALFNRRDIGSGPFLQKSPTPSTSSMSPTSKPFLAHGRSSSLSRRIKME